MNPMDNQPNLTGLNQLEAAVLMEKYTLLLGMINFGSRDQKNQARKELKEIEGFIHQHVNTAGFELAKKNLNLAEDEVDLLQNMRL